MLTLTLLQYLLGVAAGGLVGFTLGLVGGGGSILAVPLMVYLVGVEQPHVAIGTSALAVAINAAFNLAHHARRGHVKWPCASVFAGTGMLGALAGSTLGKQVDGQALLALFALLMLVIAFLMLRQGQGVGNSAVVLGRSNAGRLVGTGAAAGALSGFFGIGGGFLIVPGLIAATGMPMLYAIGSSLVAVLAFGLTTTINYALSGLVDWVLAAVFVAGGVLGGWFGTRLAVRLSVQRRALTWVFAGIVIVSALYMLLRSLPPLVGSIS